MKKYFVLLFIMSFGVVTSSCVNMFAVKELNDSAVDYIKKGDYESAIARLESSLDLDSSSYETRYNLAYTYLKAEKCDKALENIDIALKNAKTPDANAYYTKAVALTCLAENIYKKTDENGEKETIEYTDEATKAQKKDEYIELLTKANENFEKYISMSTNADDLDKVKAEIEENQEQINKINDEDIDE